MTYPIALKRLVLLLSDFFDGFAAGGGDVVCSRPMRDADVFLDRSGDEILTHFTVQRNNANYRVVSTSPSYKPSYDHIIASRILDFPDFELPGFSVPSF